VFVGLPRRDTLRADFPLCRAGFRAAPGGAAVVRSTWASVTLREMASATYIPMRTGWVYLVAVMDWFSRCVLAWELSVTMDVSFGVEALQRALRLGTPEIFNTDQGSQFTAAAFTDVLKDAGIAISMDGRGRA
jgi:transposase InsO family protein